MSLFCQVSSIYCSSIGVLFISGNRDISQRKLVNDMGRYGLIESKGCSVVIIHMQNMTKIKYEC